MPNRLTVCDCSYDAAENEISFREGDCIIGIEAVSYYWWQDKMADGGVGLFPGIFSPTSVPGTPIELSSDVANCVEPSNRPTSVGLR